MSATLSKITITFLRDAVDGDTLQFRRTNQDTLVQVEMLETFQDAFRSSNYEIQVGTPTATAGETTAEIYAKYFPIDYNGSGVMTITNLLNVVEIEIAEPYDLSDLVATAGLVSEVVVSRLPSTFSLTSASLQVHPTAPCDYVDIEILTTEQANGYSLGRGVITLVATNPFTVSVPRTVPTIIYVHKGGEILNISKLQNNDPHFYFRKLYSNNITANVITSPLLGATVTISVSYTGQLTQLPTGLTALTYSLDGVIFQSSNVFTGQAEGDYTVYVKDSLGCTVTKDYSVSGNAGRDKYFKVAAANSIPFSKNETWDGAQDGIHKNRDNTLSGSETHKTNWAQNDIFRKEDSVRIQFKSNYTEHRIHIENCEGVDAVGDYAPDKMSTNLDLFESLDCWGYQMEGGRLGIYFTDGTVYDELGNDVGDFELNGNLPDSAITGNKVQISIDTLAGIFEIENIVYDASINKRVIVLNTDTVFFEPELGLYSSHYDLLNFEVYEFVVDFDAIIHGGLDPIVRIRIEVLDGLYGNEDYYSEYIDILDEDTYTENNGLNNLVAIRYFGTNNRSVFYIYGISHFIRAEVVSVENILIDESQVEKGDLTTYLSDSKVYEGLKIVFADVTERIKTKIALALSSEHLFINGEGLAKNSPLEIKNIENTNLYTITAELIRTGESFDINAVGKTGNKQSFKTVYIPKLIKTNLGLNIKA